MSDETKCPECATTLPFRASSCPCGWKADLAGALRSATEAAVHERRRCEMRPDCPYPARDIVNGKRTCVVHYDEALRPAPGVGDEAVHA